MDRSLSPTLPNAAFRALTASFSDTFPIKGDLELSIRLRNERLSVREFSVYLMFLDGLYGRIDPIGFRSYAQQAQRQLTIRHIKQGSIDLRFLFDRLQEVEVWRALVLYVIARVGPAILKGDVLKNWAEAAKAAVETHRMLYPPQPEAPPRAIIPPETNLGVEGLNAVRRDDSDQRVQVKLSRHQRKELRQFLREDPRFSKLSDRHIREVINLIEQLLSEERHHIPAAIRFSEKYVLEVSLRPAQNE